MKRITYLILSAAALLPTPAAHSQQLPTKYVFQAIAQPNSTIGGYRLAPDTHLDNAAIGSRGDAAFIADWTDYTAVPVERGATIVAVFTATKLVTRNGDVLDDGRFIVTVDSDSPLDVNASGQVAYQAW